ncbi:MAG: adenylyltransferase/cytidyltransferase family protein [Bacteroidia bacterium]
MIPPSIPHSHLSIIMSKILTVDTIVKLTLLARLKSEKIVFTNGCFDIIHRGHIHYLALAADKGTQLIVGINSDDSVKRLGKSANRPLQDEQTRALIIASLHFVTSVIIFDEDTPANLISIIKPDVLVKGGDYDSDEKNATSQKYIVGSDIVKAYGGSVETIEYLKSFSTTAIEQKIIGN